MGFRIATNVPSLVAQRHLAKNNMHQANSLEKLSSGSRINKAADDAAGLAISEKMRGTIRSVRQNVRNAGDGISMIQVAEGAMNEVGNILIRMRELSIQAASDTVGERERSFVDKEMQQLREEVDRIANSTQFNSTMLLKGEDALEIQVGANNDPNADRFVLDISKIRTTTETLGIDSVSTETKENAQNNLEIIDSALQNLTENRSELGAMQNRLQSTIENLRIYDENLSISKSRIRDTDFADATAQLTKDNILSQATTSVLSQANSNATLALRLVG
jgi:flagellin